MITSKERRAKISEALDIAVSDFLFHDRKEDPDLPLGEIEKMVGNWDVTISEITLEFEEMLRNRIPIPADSQGYEATQAAAKVRNEKLSEQVAEIREEQEVKLA